MTACRADRGRLRRLLLAAVCLLAWPLAGAAELTPYSAVYSISRNGKLIGKAEVRLYREGENWIISSEVSGTHGLARLLRVRDREKVTGREFEEGRLQPLEYERHSRVAGIDDRWFATFDWPAGEVSVVHDRDDPIVMQLTGGPLDPLSLKLEMRRRLGEPDPRLEFLMVEEDEIDEQNFRILPPEWLETSLGCLDTVPVEKIRFNSKRYTRAWHAADMDHIEVRMEHGKTDGDHVEMRITELTVNGQRIDPRAGCSARQAAAPAETDGKS
jgi:hypothetical protein